MAAVSRAVHTPTHWVSQQASKSGKWACHALAGNGGVHPLIHEQDGAGGRKPPFPTEDHIAMQTAGTAVAGDHHFHSLRVRRRIGGGSRVPESPGAGPASTHKSSQKVPRPSPAPTQDSSGGACRNTPDSTWRAQRFERQPLQLIKSGSGSRCRVVAGGACCYASAYGIRPAAQHVWNSGFWPPICFSKGPDRIIRWGGEGEGGRRGGGKGGGSLPPAIK